MALADGLVGYWSPWLGSSGYTLLDRARTSHGSLVNMDAGTDWVGASIQGRSGRVLDFDGTNDRIEVTTQSVGAITSAVTVSVWFNLAATGRSASLFGINSTASATYRMQAHAPWSDNNIYWDFGGSSGVNRLTITGQSWTVGKWEHLVFRGGNRGMFCWRNGLLVGSSTNSATRTTNSNQFVIGGSLLDGNPPYYHQGQVAETSVFAREINNAEALELYRLGPGWYRPYAKRGYAYAAAAGFRAYWHRRQSQVIGGGLR